MPKGKRYTEDEITLCTYAAMYVFKKDFNDIAKEIHRLEGRSTDSIKMKIQNIAYMLDEANVPRHNDIKGLSGKPAGQGDRRTDWDIVAPLYPKDKSEFLKICHKILKNK